MAARRRPAPRVRSSPYDEPYGLRLCLGRIDAFVYESIGILSVSEQRDSEQAGNGNERAASGVGVEMDPKNLYLSIIESAVTKISPRFALLAGLSDDESAGLASAVVLANLDRISFVVAGDSPVPTSMTTMMADQLRFICLRAGRLLTEKEVEIVFRITSATARSVLSTMSATYEESLRECFLARMKQDVQVSPSGTEDDGLTWTLKFTERATYDTAWAEVRRCGLQAVADRPAQRTIVVQRIVGDDGTDVLSTLGIVSPAGRD